MVKNIILKRKLILFIGVILFYFFFMYVKKFFHTSHFLFHAICDTLLPLERSHLKLQRNGKDGNCVSKSKFVTLCLNNKYIYFSNFVIVKLVYFFFFIFFFYFIDYEMIIYIY